MTTLKSKDIIKSLGKPRDLSKDFSPEVKKRFGECRQNIQKSIDRVKVDWGLLRNIWFK